MLIYKATLPNKKSYIGQTVINLNRRKYQHHYNSFIQPDKLFFHKAIRKYGWENVKWKIIEDDITDINILNEREQYYIKNFKTIVPFGYNLTTGGLNTRHCEATKRKLSKLNKGRKPPILTEEGRKRLSELKKGIKNPNYGKELSQKTRIKMSKVRKGKKFTEEHKKHLSESLKKYIIPKKQRLIMQENNHGFSGKKHTEETKQKMRNYWKKRRTLK